MVERSEELKLETSLKILFFDVQIEPRAPDPQVL